MSISAIVMASGSSNRMKTNKLQMKINDKKIYEYILETINNCCFNEVIVVAKDNDVLVKADNLGFKAVKNGQSYLGQSASLKLGLNNTSLCSGYMFFVADQPFIKVSTINKLISTFNDNPDKIIIPCYNGKNGNPVIFPSYLKQELNNIEGDKGGKVVINNHIDNIIKVPIENEYEFIDIDTMEDYKKVIKMKVIE